MKILLLYTYNQGYLSSFFTELAQRLSRDGHHVNCFSMKTQNTIFDDKGVSFFIAKRGGYLRTYYQVFKIIRQIKPDVVLSNFRYVNPALLFGRILGVKKNIAWFHSLQGQMEPTKQQVFIKRWFLKLADSMIANSFLTAQELQSVYHILPSRILILPFWSNILERDIDSISFKLPQSPKVFNIGCPGRFVYHKNQHLVIDVTARLLAIGQSVHLYLAGDGEERHRLTQHVTSLGIERHVSFLGHLSATDMPAFYQQMDVIILPSLHEAFGLVFLEAISMGCPTLVSSSFGALQFIDQTRYEIDDLIFNPEDASSLEKCLMPYLNDKGLPGSYFKDLYLHTFNKDIIYQKIRTFILNPLDYP